MTQPLQLATSSNCSALDWSDEQWSTHVKTQTESLVAAVAIGEPPRLTELTTAGRLPRATGNEGSRRDRSSPPTPRAVLMVGYHAIPAVRRRHHGERVGFGLITAPAICATVTPTFCSFSWYAGCVMRAPGLARLRASGLGSQERPGSSVRVPPVAACLSGPGRDRPADPSVALRVSSSRCLLGWKPRISFDRLSHVVSIISSVS